MFIILEYVQKGGFHQPLNVQFSLVQLILNIQQNKGKSYSALRNNRLQENMKIHVHVQEKSMMS